VEVHVQLRTVKFFTRYAFVEFAKKFKEMRRKKILLKPRLCNRNEDLGKQWFVEISQRDPRTDQMHRQRIYKFEKISINDFQTVQERTAFGQKIIDHYNEKLSVGWTIFNDTTTCVYEDQLQYAHEAVVYKQSRISNMNFTYWCNRYLSEELAHSGLKPDSVSNYRSRCRIFALWLRSKGYDGLDITALNNAVIIAFFEYLRNKRTLAARTYRSYSQILNAVFLFVKNKNGITESPVHSLPSNRIAKDMGAERIHGSDMELFMKEMDAVDPQLALACRFEYYCGLRPGYEVRLLKVGDIDFRRGCSKVRVIQDNAKMSRRREVVIPNVFLDYLINRWQLDKHDRNMYYVALYAHGYAFRSSEDSSWYRVLRTYAAKPVANLQ